MPEETNVQNVTANNTANDSPANQGQSNNQQTQNTQNQQSAQPKSTNYEDLYNADKSLQSFVDKRITSATQTAVNNALEKQKRLNDEKLSESERLKEMTAEQQVLFYKQKAENAEKARLRDKEIESLKSQTGEMLSENKIPDIFLSVFDFDNATAEDIQNRIRMLSEYEYYTKGELDKRISAALDEKLKQKAPENHVNNSGMNDYEARLKKAREEKNNMEAIRIKQEAFAKGITLY